MEDISTPGKIIKKRRMFLIAGIISCLISVCVVFPLERRDTNFLEDLGYTFLTLAIALLLIMFGLMGRNFFNGLLLLVLSAAIGFVFMYVAYPLVPFSGLIAVWLGIPSGIVTALIFLTVNFYLLRHIKSYRLFKQIISYSIILLIVSILFGYGGDWIFEITELFKDKL